MCAIIASCGLGSARILLDLCALASRHTSAVCGRIKIHQTEGEVHVFRRHSWNHSHHRANRLFGAKSVAH
jgi:hypothetical protein